MHSKTCRHVEVGARAFRCLSKRTLQSLFPLANAHSRRPRSKCLQAPSPLSQPVVLSSAGNNPGEGAYLNAPGLAPPLKPRTWRSRARRALIDLLPPLSSGELLRRAAFTLGLVALARLGHFLPIPGLDASQVGKAMGTMQSLTGGSEAVGNIFLLSLGPLMAANLTIASLSLVPDLRRWLERLREAGREGRQQLNALTTTLFIVFAFAEGFSLARQLAPPAPAGAAGGPLALASWLPTVRAAVNLVAGATIVKHLAQCLEEWGLGDGAGTLIGVGIAVNYSSFLLTLVGFLGEATIPLWRLAAAAALSAALAAAAVHVQGIELRLPLAFFGSRQAMAPRNHPAMRFMQPRTPSSKGGKGGEPAAAASASSGAGAAPLPPSRQPYFPLRLAPGGARQLLFANFAISLLEKPLRFFKLWEFARNPWGFALLVFLMESCSLPDATPRQVAEFLAQSQIGIKGLSPGPQTERFLALRRAQLRLLSAALVSLLSLAAAAVDAACEALLGAPLASLQLLLLASTVAAGGRQVSALLKRPQVERLIEDERRVFEGAAG